MKKRIIAVLLIATIFVTLFAGCDVITKNEERDAKQVVATITYGGHTDNVTKQELINAYNSYGYYYTYYYGYTVEETFDLIVKSLAQRQLLILYAKSYFAPDGYEDGIKGLEAMLSSNEVKHCIEAINDELEETLKSNIEELEDEVAALEGEVEDDNQPIKLIQSTATEYEIGDVFDASIYRISITDDEDVTTTIDITDDMIKAIPDISTSGKKEFVVTYNGTDYTYTFEVASLEPRAVRPSNPEVEYDADDVYTGELPAKFGSDSFVSEYADNEYYEDALSDLKKTLENNFATFDTYYENELETALLSKLQRALGAGILTAEKLQSELDSKAEVTVLANKESYEKLATAYATALKNDVTAIGYHQTLGYGYVYNILLKFSDEQSELLAKYADGDTQGIYYSSDEVYYQLRQILAGQITVNISNLYYDADYECEYHDCDIENCNGDCSNHTCGNAECPARAYVAYDVPVGTVLGWIKADLDEANAITNKFERQMAIREVAIQWIYRVNDDTGMFDEENTETGITGGGYGYIVTPEGESSDYVDEFTNLGRDLVKQGIGSYEIAAADVSDVVDYGFSTYPTESTSTNGIWYCITDYGIHIMIVSYIPYDFNAFGIDGERIFANDAEGQAVFDKMETPMDYIVSYGRLVDAEGSFSYVESSDGSYVLVDNNFVIYDATKHAELSRYNIAYAPGTFYDADGLMKYSQTLTTKTYGDLLKEKVESSANADGYSVIANRLIQDEADAIVNNDKLYKKLIKETEQ